MNDHALLEILQFHYGLDNVSIQFLRKGGGLTYLVEGENKYLLKIIGAAFASTSRQSVEIMRYLEEYNFPVPRTILTLRGEPFLELPLDGEDHLVIVQEFINGQEPDLESCADKVGALVGQLHTLLEQYPEKLLVRDKHFFIGRYLDFLQQKKYPQLAEYKRIGDALWLEVENQSKRNCHGDLHRGNLLQDRNGNIFFLDFDTVCCAPTMFDVMVMCDMTNYFRLEQTDIAVTKIVYKQFISGYSLYNNLNDEELKSFDVWVAIRHFQLQATILEIHGIDCVQEKFIDNQLDWLKTWLTTATHA